MHARASNVDPHGSTHAPYRWALPKRGVVTSARNGPPPHVPPPSADEIAYRELNEVLARNSQAMRNEAEDAYLASLTAEVRFDFERHGGDWVVTAITLPAYPRSRGRLSSSSRRRPTSC